MSVRSTQVKKQPDHRIPHSLQIQIDKKVKEAQERNGKELPCMKNT